MAGPKNTEGKEMKKEKCANCGSNLVSRKVEYDKKVGQKRVLFESVPASVCLSCDEVWLDGKVAEKMEQLFRAEIKPIKWLKIPIYPFSQAA